MSTALEPRVYTHRSRYESVEHESLRAICRSTRLHFGQEAASLRISGLMLAMGVDGIAWLSPFGANFCRKFLEKHLPECLV